MTSLAALRAELPVKQRSRRMAGIPGLDPMHVSDFVE